MTRERTILEQALLDRVTKLENYIHLISTHLPASYKELTESQYLVICNVVSAALSPTERKEKSNIIYLK